MTNKEQEQHENAVVEAMARAHTLAENLFGAQSDTYAVEEIYDYLQVNEDEDDFLTDLKRVIECTKKAYGTTAPTPEQVFGVFERIFEEDEE